MWDKMFSTHHSSSFLLLHIPHWCLIALNQTPFDRIRNILILCYISSMYKGSQDAQANDGESTLPLCICFRCSFMYNMQVPAKLLFFFQTIAKLGGKHLVKTARFIHCPKKMLACFFYLIASKPGLIQYVTQCVTYVKSSFAYLTENFPRTYLHPKHCKHTMREVGSVRLFCASFSQHARQPLTTSFFSVVLVAQCVTPHPGHINGLHVRL